jgi:hypothetical protein
MPALPAGGALLVRTDFADDRAWDQVQEEAQREYGPDGFRAYIEPVSDPAWSGAAWESVKAAAPVDESGPSVLFIADSVTFATPEHPILVVDLEDKYLSLTEFPEIADRTPFRCIPPALWSVENNLSIANLDWEDFAESTDGDGVYRAGQLPPGPTPEEKAEAEQQARLQEQRQLEIDQLADEVRYWGGSLPSEPIRAAKGNARALAELDVGLAEAIAAASPLTQRSIARWAARRAYEVAGIAGLDWVAPALEALDDERQLPSPFDNHRQAWQLLLNDPRMPHTTVAPIDEHIAALETRRMLQSAMAFPALFEATEPDPLDAALRALFAAAVTFGRDRYRDLFQEVRATYSL